MFGKYSVYFFATLLIAATSCSKMINVKHVKMDSALPKEDGVYYSLPKTVITVEVDVSKTYKIKGQFSGFANKYLGLSNVITENSSSFSIDDIKLSDYSLPDHDQYYFVEIPNSCRKKNSVLLQLSETGIINSINGYNKLNNKTNSIISSDATAEDVAKPAVQTFLNSNMMASFDTTIEKIDMDTFILQKKIIKKIYVDKNEEQKAKEAADYIMKIKENEFNLLTGYSEVNFSKESLEYMHEQLKKQESEYLNLFTGATVVHHFKFYYTYNPVDSKSKANIPLFLFSAKDGISDTSSNKGESVNLKIEKLDSSNVLEPFNDAKLDLKKKHHGFYYRIPEYAKVSVCCNNKIKAESNILVSQFGVVCELPAINGIKALYYPNSGEVKTISVNEKHHHFWHFKK